MSAFGVSYRNMGKELPSGAWAARCWICHWRKSSSRNCSTTILSLEQSRSHTLVNSPGTFSWLSSYIHFPTHEENLTGLILWAFQEGNPAVNKNNSDHSMPRGQNFIKTSILKQYPSLIHLFTHSLLTCFLAFWSQKSNIIFLENVEKVLLYIAACVKS